jgi:hypothetical protein
MFGLFGKRDASDRRQKVEKIERLANACQLELYRTVEQALGRRYDQKTTGELAAALSNYIMQFGLINSQHASDALLVQRIRQELRSCYTFIDYKVQQNSLGCIILLASAWRIPLDKFTGHIRSLHQFKLFDLGSNTPDVRKDLTAEDFVYMYEAAAIGTNSNSAAS